MRKLIATGLIARGRGTVRETEKEANFKIPERMSIQGIESIRRKFNITRFELEEPYVMLLYRPTKDAVIRAIANPNLTTEKLTLIREIHDQTVQMLRHNSLGPEADTKKPPARRLG